MNVSVLSYSFRGLLAEGKMDLFGYLETCKYRYHLSAADIWSGFFPSTNPDYLKKVKEELDERELVLADLCVDNVHVWDSQPDVRERNYQNAQTYLKVADTLGARFMRVEVGRTHGQMRSSITLSCATRSTPNGHMTNGFWLASKTIGDLNAHGKI